MTLKRMLLTTFLGAGLSTISLAADWSRFRGPNGSGVVEGTVPVKFDVKKDATWKTKIPGTGHSSPIVVKDKIILQTTGDDLSRSLLCVDAKNGTIEWSKIVQGGTKQAMHKLNSGASSTPASDGESIYLSVWDGKGITLYAYDFKGTKLWSKGVGEYFSQHGAAHSPMTYDGMVYFSMDDDNIAKFLALDAKTGDIKWTKERKKERASYATPIVLDRPGKASAIVIGTTTGVDAYDPKTGNSIWSYPINWTATGVKPLRAIGQPLIANGSFYTYFGEGGSGRYMVAVKTDGTGDVSAKGKVWDSKEKDKTPYVPSLIAYKDHIYWVNDTGFAACAEAKTGKILWYERAFPKKVSASPILVGDTILGIDESGKMVAFKASSKKYEEVDSSNLGEAVFASPAGVNGRLIIRGTEHLFCFGGKGS